MSSDAHRRLEELLDRELDAARSLSATLAAERAALTGSSPDDVRQSAAEKMGLLAAIEAMEDVRRALWKVVVGNDFPGATIFERWRALLDLMTLCRNANEVNGHIIFIRQHQIQQLLGIVRGGTPATYGRHGQTFSTAQRELARA